MCLSGVTCCEIVLELARILLGRLLWCYKNLFVFPHNDFITLLINSVFLVYL